MRRPRIHLIGNVNVDLIMGQQDAWPRPGTEVMLSHSEIRVGGSAGNAALALEALGMPFQFHTSCGTDLFGRWLRKELGAAAEGLTRAKAATTISLGISHAGGERTFFTGPGHLSELALGDVLKTLPARAGAGDIALLVGTFLSPPLMADYETLIAALRARGFRLALDTGWPAGGWGENLRRRVRTWLGSCDFLLFNEIEIMGLTGTATLGVGARRLLRDLDRTAILVAKRGRRGAEAWRGKEHAKVAAPRVAVVDTIGAGDVFNAGFLAAIVKRRGLASALEAGVSLASRAIATHPRRYGGGAR